MEYTPARRYAVILADVVASGARKRLPALLRARLREATRIHRRSKLILLPYAVTAGDEFETITGNISKISDLLLDLRIRMQPISLRIGVGIGEVPGRIRPPVNQLEGVAFRRARAALDSLKRGRKGGSALTAFRTPDEEFDRVANLIYRLQDTLVRKMTQKQWRTVSARLAHRSIQDTARALRLDASTVSRNLKRGFYPQLLAAATGIRDLAHKHSAAQSST